jgi:predicted ATP-binding protein involved in virulence
MKKQLFKMVGLVPASLLDKIDSNYRQMLENMISANEIEQETNAMETMNCLRIIRLALHEAKKSNLPEAKMLNSIILQLPNAHLN